MVGEPNKTEMDMVGAVHQSAISEVQFSEERRWLEVGAPGESEILGFCAIIRDRTAFK